MYLLYSKIVHTISQHFEKKSSEKNVMPYWNLLRNYVFSVILCEIFDCCEIIHAFGLYYNLNFNCIQRMY